MIPMKKSETLTWVSGDTKQFAIDRFLSDTRGPRGGILVIDALHIRATLNLTTAGGVTLLGPDHANFIKKLRIHDNAGVRRFITGAKVRTMAHYDLGSRVPADPATFAAATTADASYDFIIPFTQPYSAFRGVDFGLPVHDIVGGGGVVELLMPTGAQLQGTGGTPTINSGSYVMTAYLRELPPGDKQFFARDVVEEHSQTSNTDLVCYPKGRILRDAVIYKEAAGGGSSLANVLSYTQQQLGYTAISRAALKNAYLHNRDVTSGQDPFFNDKALALHFGRFDAQIEDHPIFGGEVLLQLDSSVTTPDVIARYIAPKDKRAMEIAAVRMGVSPNARIRVKTRGKTRQDPKAWGRYAQFMPAKADEPR